MHRAALLFGLFALFRSSLRRIAPGVALSWVAGAILLFDASALFDVGAQLSFSACAVLVASGFWTDGRSREDASDLRANRGGRLLRASVATFRVSLVVSLGTVPLVAQYGMPLSLVSPLLNVVAIPWAGLLVLPCSFVAVAMPDWMFDATASWGASMLFWPAETLAGVAEGLVERFPEPSVVGWKLPWFALVASSVAALWATRSGRWTLALSVWVALCFVGARPFDRGPFAPTPPQIVFFDVGQGDAALVQGREATLLIDTGPGPVDGSGGAALLRALLAVGVHSIDVLVVTHGDLDHRGGAARVLRSVPVAELWLPASGGRDEPLRALAAIARDRGTRVLWQSADDRVRRRGDLGIEVLWPPAAGSSPDASRNAGSMVLRVSLEGISTLFSADIGVAEEARLLALARERLDVDVLKVPHHGSRSASSPAFLEAVSPDLVIVSAPCDPTRGLPSQITLDRLVRADAGLGWTGRDGAVFVAPGSAGTGLEMRSWGRSHECEARR